MDLGATLRVELPIRAEITSEHFSLRFPKAPRSGSADQLARDILQVLERGLDLVSRDLSMPPGARIPVVAYTADDFDARYRNITGGVILGVQLPGERTIVDRLVIGRSSCRRSGR
jgi:hypothetical protein